MMTPILHTRPLSWVAGLAGLLVCTLPLAGQTNPQEPSDPAQQAASDAVVAPAAPEYTGPAILSRANLPSIGPGSAPTMIQPFFYVNQIYDTGMAVTSGTVGAPFQPVAGVETGFGLSGTHRWRRIILDISYDGNYRRYTQQTPFAGTNQYLTATALIPLKRHLDLTIGQTATSLVQGFTSLSLQPTEWFGTQLTNQPFNNRMTWFDSRVALKYQKSRRLSFTAAVEGSVVDLASPLLVGTHGVSAMGDVAYLLTRHVSIGVDYSFAHYGYTTFGSADISTMSGNFSWRLSRTVDASLQFGVARRDILGLALVPLDPDVAAILGVASGIQVSRDVYNAPAFDFRLSKRWHHATADVGFQRSTSAGNGLLLTSDATSVEAGLQYTPSRRWNFSFHAGRTQLQALPGMQELTSTGFTSYNNYIGDVSLTRTIGPTLQIVARFDVRPFTDLYAGYPTRTFYSSSIGFRFTPREIPVVLR